MRKLILILILTLFNASIFGQTYVGTTIENSNAYSEEEVFNVALIINHDSTITFIYDRNYQDSYGEFNGRITKLNDTLFQISATMTIGQSCMKSFNLDTFYIQLYKNIATQLDKITLEYSDGKTRTNLRGYDSLGNPIRLLKIPVDNKLLNNKEGSNFVNITINRKNLLSDNFLTFKIPYGSASIFKAGEQIVFNVVINNGELYTTEAPRFLYRNFRLKCRVKDR